MKSTPTQLANLDRDHDGHPGGSLPKPKPAAVDEKTPAVEEAAPAMPYSERRRVMLGLPVILMNPDGSRHVRGQTDFAALVTRIDDENETVSLTAFMPNRGPELHINIKHRDDAKPSDRFRWRHLDFPGGIDALPKSVEP